MLMKHQMPAFINLSIKFTLSVKNEVCAAHQWCASTLVCYTYQAVLHIQAGAVCICICNSMGRSEMRDKFHECKVEWQ